MAHAEGPETVAAMACYGAQLLSMLEVPLPLADSAPNELAPRPYRCRLRRRMWTRFGDRVETMLSSEGVLRPVAGLANKLPEHAARIAGVLTPVRDIAAGEIAGDEMAAGIEIAQHYAAEALRLDGGSHVSSDLRTAQRALEWLMQHWLESAISLPDLYQRGPAAIRDAQAARRTVAILEDHGWLVALPQGGVIAGTRRRDAWRIVRG